MYSSFISPIHDDKSIIILPSEKKDYRKYIWPDIKYTMARSND